MIDPKRTEEICAEINELLDLQCKTINASDNMTAEQAKEFELRRRKMDVLLAELDVLAARSH